MAINPLVVFVGLSAAAVGGIVYVNQIKTPLLDTAPVVQDKRTVPMPEPVVKPPEKVASLPRRQVEPKPDLTQKKPPETKAAKPAVKTPPPPMPDLSGPAATVPSFDVVRIEKDGGAVVVGKAAPDVTVKLLLNGKPFGSTKSNAKGDWVFIPDALIPAGNHQLVLEAKGSKSGKMVKSAQTIVIALAKKKQAKPLVVVASNDAPSKVLQKPAAKATSVKKPEVAREPVTREAQKGDGAATAQKAPTQKKDIANNQAKKAPAITPTPVATAKKPAALEPVADDTTTRAMAPPSKIAPVVKKKPAARKPVAVKKPLPTRQSLAFGTIDYNDSGNMVFSGTATPNKKIRLYVDNKFVGDVVSDAQGKWVFGGRRDIKPGVHQLRADLITPGGAVTRRAAVPFVRANPVKVAALLKTRVQKKPSVAKQPEMVKATKPKINTAPEKPAKSPQDTAMREAEVLTPKNKVPAGPAVQKARDPNNKMPAQVGTAKTVDAKPKAPAPLAADADKTKTAAKAIEKKQIKDATSETPSPSPALKVARVPDAAKPDDPAKTQKTPEQVSHVVIQPGNNLWNISRVIYGKGIAYTTIFQANKEQIKDPDRIYPGQIFDTPGATSSGSISPDLRAPEASTVQ